MPAAGAIRLTRRARIRPRRRGAHNTDSVNRLQASRRRVCGARVLRPRRICVPGAPAGTQELPRSPGTRGAITRRGKASDPHACSIRQVRLRPASDSVGVPALRAGVDVLTDENLTQDSRVRGGQDVWCRPWRIALRIVGRLRQRGTVCPERNRGGCFRVAQRGRRRQLRGGNRIGFVERHTVPRCGDQRGSLRRVGAPARRGLRPASMFDSRRHSYRSGRIRRRSTHP